MPSSHELPHCSPRATLSSNHVLTMSPPPVNTVATARPLRATSLASMSPLASASGSASRPTRPAGPDPPSPRSARPRRGAGPRAPDRPDPPRGSRPCGPGRSRSRPRGAPRCRSTPPERPSTRAGRSPYGRRATAGPETPLEGSPEVLRVGVHPVEPVDHRGPAQSGPLQRPGRRTA